MITRHSIDISAPPAVVWRATVDVERWPDWSPAIQSVKRLDDGPFAVGTKALIKQKAMGPTEWTVNDLTQDRRFSWETRKRGLRMVGTHEVIPIGLGTNSILSLEITGPLGLLLWPVLSLAMTYALSIENRGLKTWCESQSPIRGGVAVDGR